MELCLGLQSSLLSSLNLFNHVLFMEILMLISETRWGHKVLIDLFEHACLSLRCALTSQKFRHVNFGGFFINWNDFFNFRKWPLILNNSCTTSQFWNMLEMNDRAFCISWSVFFLKKIIYIKLDHFYCEFCTPDEITFYMVQVDLTWHFEIWCGQHGFSI